MKKATAVIAVLLTILLHSFIWIKLQSSIPNIEEENGIMENYQAIGLLICVGMFVGVLLKSHVRGEKIFFLSLALFALSLLVLEVDFRKMNAPTLNKIMNGRIRDIWLGALWVVAAILFWKNRAPVLATFVRWVRSPAGWIMIIGGVCWVFATLVDKGFLGTKTLFKEELLEVNAALLMVASGAITIFQRNAPKTRTAS